jgi:hypothetical protein
VEIGFRDDATEFTFDYIVLRVDASIEDPDGTGVEINRLSRPDSSHTSPDFIHI